MQIWINWAIAKGSLPPDSQPTIDCQDVALIRSRGKVKVDGRIRQGCQRKMPPLILVVDNPHLAHDINQSLPIALCRSRNLWFGCEPVITSSHLERLVNKNTNRGFDLSSIFHYGGLIRFSLTPTAQISA